MVRYRFVESERRHARLATVCNGCAGVAYARECKSLDCAVYYERLKHGERYATARDLYETHGAADDTMDW